MTRRRKRKEAQVTEAVQALPAPVLVVDNPEYQPGNPDSIRYVAAPRQLRDDPLGQMHDRRQIEEHQYRAGRQFQDDWEVSGRSGRMTGMDTTQEPVDGGRAPSSRLGVTDRGMAAAQRLRAYEAVLGTYGWKLAKLVLVDKRTLREATQVLHVDATRPAHLTFVGHRFRECLNTLAEMMGLAS